MIGIIPAAGYGTRLKELGKIYPKCILPYKEKPLLIWNIKWLIKQGCDEIRIIVNQYNKEKIYDIIKNYKFPIKIIDPIDMSGLSTSILSAIKNDSKTNSILIVLSDILVRDTEQNIDFNNNWVSVSKVSDWQRWCMIDPATGEFYDKPINKPPTNLALSGVYFFTDSEHLKNKLIEQYENKETINEELQLSTAIKKMNLKINIVDLPILDFGTLDDFLKNKDIVKCRAFNSITFNNHLVIKKSIKNNKIISEYNWFNNIPIHLKPFTPRIFGSNLFATNTEYTIERVYNPTLKEIYLYLDRSDETWIKIFKSCLQIQELMNQYSYNYSSFNKIYKKTINRVYKARLNKIPIVKKFLRHFKSLGGSIDTKTKLQHGDFCFSNLFWDNLKSSIIMIDPNGEMFGSKYYDWAKLRHSAIYNYDFIDSELYSISNKKIKVFDDESKNVGQILSSIEKTIFTSEELVYLEILTASLFLSMIPLHNHNKINQKIYYNKFKEIYEKFN